MKLLQKTWGVLFREGLLNFIKRKRTKMFMENAFAFTMNYKNLKTKILLRRRFGHVDEMILKYGIYEQEIVDDIFEELDNTKNLIDIGANIGQHSLLLAPFAKNVYSFEPLPDVFEQFQKSINLNHYTNVHAYNIAISDKKEEKKFNYVRYSAGTSSFIAMENTTASEITVQTNLLENVLKDVKIDVIKLDVEGYEAVVILGNKDKISKDKPVIFLEYSPEWILREGSFSPFDLVDFFHQNDYEIYSRNEKRIIEKNDVKLEGQDNWTVKIKS